MIGSWALKARVEENLGVALAPTSSIRRKGGGSMRRRKPSLPKWKYAFSCRDCRHVQFIKDEAKGREGDYCVKSIERADAGLPGPIHADEADRVVRCDCYEPIPKEGDPA